MNQYEMVVLIVFIVMLASVLNRRAHRRKTHLQQKEEDVRARLEQLDALEERVRVLEKIVTDRRFDLRQEFRDLGS